MNKLFTILVLALASTLINAQTISESFNAPFNPSTAGWVLINNSTPSPVNNWVQGTGTVFPAFSGGTNDYFSASYTSAGTATNIVAGISNWLITPTVTISNGSKLTFATRRNAGTNVYPDRMIVRMSTAGASTAIPTGSTSVGTFTRVLLDINPLYTTGGAGIVTTPTTVSSYPSSWTIYTITLSGVTGNLTGRFAFHYFVDNGGPAGANSDYIGLDDVNYTLACGGATSNFSISGSGLTYNFTNNSTGAASYLWNFGDLTTSTLQNPPQKVYSSPGAYVVELDITSTVDGCVIKSSQTINATNANSISENTLLNSYIKLQPNPAKSSLYLTNTNNDLNFTEPISIFNYLGVKVKSISNIDINDKKTSVIDTEDLPIGMYFINAKTNQGYFTKSFIKN